MEGLGKAAARRGLPVVPIHNAASRAVRGICLMTNKRLSQHAGSSRLKFQAVCRQHPQFKGLRPKKTARYFAIPRTVFCNWF